MSDIANAFDHGKAFIAFVTAGDPCFEKTVEFVLKMVEAGADLIELGVPFSDPIADGPVIQAANLRAFADGTTTDRVFEMVEEIRKHTDVPLVLLTYLNPVYKYGYEAFMRRGADVGLDGLIVPDLPIEEKAEVGDVAKRYGIDVISLIAPTSNERVKAIASDASGFLYVVSSMGVTGVRSEIETDLGGVMKTIRAVSDVPTAIGFGISTPEQAKQMAQYADGVIVGSAIVKIIARYGEGATPYLVEYVENMKDALR
ncbi:MAG: tryptophan synthase subunit alpha [Actinobacteria bacterium]|nr:tryptophan synthase subunit alpha [Actinomycetota bacterium]